MYRTYLSTWESHAAKYGPRTALLYQVGGFYEIYDVENLTTGTTRANVREIAEICQLSLTAHAVDDDTQTLFGGVPEGALGKYERILVGAGYTVVVVSQRKGSTGAVEERVVEHISSPGCYMEGAGGGSKERRLVGCILESLTDGPAALRRVYWAAVALDVATGGIWFVEGTDRDRLHQFLCLHPPAEMVVWSDGGAAATGLLDLLRSGAGAAAFHVRCLAAASVAVDEAILGRFWSPVRTRLEWLCRAPQSRRCLAALMEFAAEHLPSALRSLQIPTIWVADGDVRLGNAALEQLGVLSLRGESDRQCLLGILDQCRSVAGRRLLRTRLLRPISDVTELNRRLDLVDRVGVATPEVTARTEKALRSFYDMSRLWRRLELGAASVGDLACLLRSYAAAADLLGIWSSNLSGCDDAEAATWCAAMATEWSADTLTDMSREGQSVPVIALPCLTADVTLRTAFAAGESLRAEAQAIVTAWSAMGRGEPLYLADAEGGGFRVTGTKRRISAVLTALRDGGDLTAEISTHKTSAVLETAGLRDLSARHRAWWHSWSAIWAEAWATAQESIVTRGRAVHQWLLNWCAELDVAWTVQRIAQERLWRRPVFVEDATESWIAVDRLRHPILERLTTVPYIPHTLTLGKLPHCGSGSSSDGSEDPGCSPRGLLLYGMNAAGKSSLMKAVGLCVVLAQCGFPVPAAACRLSPFTALFTRILGNDNLWAGLSSFAVEMTEFREILRFADARSLVLGDELCAGTESLSATALVAAGVETLAGRGTKFVFATHLHELATMPDIAGHSGVRAVHLRVHYDAASDRLVYDRELANGSGSALYGLEVCRALDLPAGYLERAMALRSQLAGDGVLSQSTYSSGAVVGRCEVCGAGASAGLETHHIRPQADRVAAAAEGFAIHGAGNLVCLCAGCHDDHHAGRLIIRGWQETSAGRRLVWNRHIGPAGGCGDPDNGEAEGGSTGGGTAVRLTEELVAWIREQRRLKIPMATLKRMARVLFGGIELTTAEVRAIK
jgi:DNA mismatch repair protein MutS